VSRRAARRDTCDVRLVGDRGAVLTEFVLVLPFLMVIVMGLLEYGNAYRHRTALESTVATAGRSNAQIGAGRFADFETLRSISSGASAIRGVTIERVVVWNATATSDGPRCTTGSSVNGLCNVYDTAQVNDASGAGFAAGTSYSPTCATGSWDEAWCPLDRSDEYRAQDYVGVYVEIRYPSLSRFFTGTDQTMRAWNVYRIEPPVGGP
jgi:Flp pilus assembly protein TadG